MLTHLSLFSGIGGLDIAAEWAGFVTVGQCEWAEFPTKVLEKHWPQVPRWKDIKTLTKESFYEMTGLKSVSVISGGFPCQPFSTAGKQRGKEDDRYLWPEMFRIIKELRPTWVVGENVAGIRNLALDDILSDLEREGYKTRAFMVPAAGVGALHKRDRFAILAYTDCDGKRYISARESGCVEKKSKAVCEREWSKSVDNESKRLGFCKREQIGWESESGICRVAYGIPNQVDRLRALGNAVVPEQFFPFFEAIAKIENKSE